MPNQSKYITNEELEDFLQRYKDDCSPKVFEEIKEIFKKEFIII